MVSIDQRPGLARHDLDVTRYCRRHAVELLDAAVLDGRCATDRGNSKGSDRFTSRSNETGQRKTKPARQKSFAPDWSLLAARPCRDGLELCSRCFGPRPKGFSIVALEIMRR